MMIPFTGQVVADDSWQRTSYMADSHLRSRFDRFHPRHSGPKTPPSGRDSWRSGPRSPFEPARSPSVPTYPYPAIPPTPPTSPSNRSPMQPPAFRFRHLPPSALPFHRPFPARDPSAPASPRYGSPPGPGHPPYPPPAPAPPIPNKPRVNLQEHPRDVTFPTEEALNEHMVDTFRPLCKIVALVVANQLHLAHRPRVKFDMYAVRINEVTGGIKIRPFASSRAPLFRVTLPMRGISEAQIQRASDAIKETLGGYRNEWYRLAGYVFRTSRRASRGPRGGGRSSNTNRHHDVDQYWLPPGCVYKLVARKGGRDAYYRARVRSPQPRQVLELAHRLVNDEENDDDHV
ncbi:hypothetical protein GGR52DRAFT_560826 [Hypoxylon sp. FL1284]|nr:hypothetical protein GGR52DRAFT_560826 [Hypoxylon sp. FL1284]